MKSNRGFHGTPHNLWVMTVLPIVGYGVHGYGYGVGKPDPQVTRFKLYVALGLSTGSICLFEYVSSATKE